MVGQLRSSTLSLFLFLLSVCSHLHYNASIVSHYTPFQFLPFPPIAYSCLFSRYALISYVCPLLLSGGGLVSSARVYFNGHSSSSDFLPSVMSKAPSHAPLLPSLFPGTRKGTIPRCFAFDPSSRAIYPVPTAEIFRKYDPRWPPRPSIRDLQVDSDHRIVSLSHPVPHIQ